MFEIGESLAAARRAQRLELADVEALTRIRQRQLAALEAERFDLLPGRAYTRAFLRTYAGALGLDADHFVAEFEERYPEPEEVEQVPRLLPKHRRRVPVRALVALAAAAAIGVFVAWSGTSHQSSLPRPSPPQAATAAPPTNPRRSQPLVVAKPKPATLVIHASTGDCWLLVRRGGPNGKILYEATLTQGGTLRFGPVRLWIRFGAPRHVVATRGGRPLPGLARASGDQPVNLIA